MRRVILVLFSPIIITSIAGRGGAGRCQTFYFLLGDFFPVQQTASGIGHRLIKYCSEVPGTSSFFVFSGRQPKRTLNVRNNNKNNNVYYHIILTVTVLVLALLLLVERNSYILRSSVLGSSNRASLNYPEFRVCFARDSSVRVPQLN